MEVLNLDNEGEVEKELEKYLKRECPHYLSGEFILMEGACDFRFKIIDGKESRVLVYDVKLNNQEAFGTIGGVLYPEHPPYSNVFPKPEVEDAETAAKLHLYWEGVNRYETFKKADGGLERLADVLGVPEKFRE